MIIANVQSHEKMTAVRILDLFEAGGVKLACVQALAGKPFVGGDKWPVRTEFATVKTSDLQGMAVQVDVAQKDRQSVEALAAA